jgi:hypothetical protein
MMDLKQAALELLRLAAEQLLGDVRFAPPVDPDPGQAVPVGQGREADEAWRRQRFEQAEQQYEAAHAAWMQDREACLQRIMGWLRWKILRGSRPIDVCDGDLPLPPDLRAWAKRQYDRGILNSEDGRIYVTLTLQSVIEWAELNVPVEEHRANTRYAEFNMAGALERSEQLYTEMEAERTALVVTLRKLLKERATLRAVTTGDIHERLAAVDDTQDEINLVRARIEQLTGWMATLVEPFDGLPELGALLPGTEDLELLLQDAQDPKALPPAPTRPARRPEREVPNPLAEIEPVQPAVPA